MKGARDILHDEAKLRLKVATKKLIKAVHGTELAAEITGSRQQRMSDCQLANTPDFLRISEVHDLQDAARGSEGWPQITRAMARIHGFELLPLPGQALGSSDWHQSLADVSREVGDAVGKICAALANDGQVTAEEVKEGGIVEEVDDAIAKLAVLRGLCEAAPSFRGRPQLRVAD